MASVNLEEILKLSVEEKIRLRPLAHPCVHGEIRRILMRRFPYAIYYAVGERKVEVGRGDWI